MNIFFDLDGTLLDSRERLYLLFQNLVPESKLSFEEYWSLKRNKITHREILEIQFCYSNQAIKLFEENWMQKIELPEWLAFDKPFEGLNNFLRDLGKRYNLYVITARQFKEIAKNQIEQLGWNNLFKEILVTEHKDEKYTLIKSTVTTSKEDWLIGDSGKDIQTGKQLGFRTAAVLSGFLSKHKLLEYKPDIIIDTVFDFPY